MGEKQVKIIFAVRILLWIIAAGATGYWIYWSFALYHQGIYDVYDYAKIFRPIFGKSLLVTAVCIIVCLILRAVSDHIKKVNRGY